MTTRTKPVTKNGLQNKTVSITGLELTNTDVLLHLEFINGSSHTAQLTPSNRFYVIPEEASTLQVIKTYTWLGIEHILLGFDHLLFVLLVVLFSWSLHQLNQQKILNRAETAVIYSTGGLSSFWLFERISLL